MKQEDKELLLKDLCARLPYGVFCNIGLDYPLQLQSLFVDKLDGILLDFYKDGKDYQVYLSEVKPYLFPFSSMTEEQKEELNKKFNVQFLGNTIYSIHYHSEGCWDTDLELGLQDWLWFINWCYKNHFDINNLIEKGLAIDATGLNIY